MKLEEVAIIIDTKLVEIHSSDYRYSYRAEFPGIEIKQDSCLVGAVAFGETAIKARENLAKELRRATLVKNAYTPKRWEVTLPKTIFAELQNCCI